jgi:hypothetical protein
VVELRIGREILLTGHDDVNPKKGCRISNGDSLTHKLCQRVAGAREFLSRNAFAVLSRVNGQQAAAEIQ